MEYELGDIIIVKGTVFKDTGLYDYHIYGRPVLVLDANDDYFYYLTISTKIGKVYDQDQYQKYCGHDKNGDDLNAYINCNYIYKRKIEFHTIRETLKPKVLLFTLERLIHVQEHILKDEFYDEIEERVKQYVNRREEVSNNVKTYHWNNRAQR